MKGIGLTQVLELQNLGARLLQLPRKQLARAMVIRDHLVKNFTMDDTRFKTMGVGKTQQTTGDSGLVEILIYAPGTSLTSAGHNQR